MDDVLAAQDSKFAAQMAGDLAALAEILADDLTYIHANGQPDDKAAFLAGPVRDGYLSIVRSEGSVRRYGDVAIITGTADIQPIPELRFMARFTDVWQKRGDRWINVAWQSTRAD